MNHCCIKEEMQNLDRYKASHIVNVLTIHTTHFISAHPVTMTFANTLYFLHSGTVILHLCNIHPGCVSPGLPAGQLIQSVPHFQFENDLQSKGCQIGATGWMHQARWQLSYTWNTSRNTALASRTATDPLNTMQSLIWHYTDLLFP